jgi:hypothetical protein
LQYIVSRGDIMGNDERGKLRTMLHYWARHNREHSQEFREWADKIAKLGEVEAAGKLEQAAQEMDKASQSLSDALNSLEKGR